MWQPSPESCPFSLSSVSAFFLPLEAESWQRLPTLASPRGASLSFMKSPEPCSHFGKYACHRILLSYPTQMCYLFPIRPLTDTISITVLFFVLVQLPLPPSNISALKHNRCPQVPCMTPTSLFSAVTSSLTLWEKIEAMWADLLQFIVGGNLYACRPRPPHLILLGLPLLVQPLFLDPMPSGHFSQASLLCVFSLFSFFLCLIA